MLLIVNFEAGPYNTLNIGGYLLSYTLDKSNKTEGQGQYMQVVNRIIVRSLNGIAARAYFF